MNKSLYLVLSLLVAMSMLLAACQPAATEAPAVEEPAATEAPAATEEPVAEEPAETEAPAAEEPAEEANPGLQMESAAVAEQFFTEEDYQKSLELMSATALNPDAPIYLQYLVEDPTDYRKYPQYASFAEKEAPYNVCFSNAGVNNPWRVVGYIDMREQVEAAAHRGPGEELLPPRCPG